MPIPSDFLRLYEDGRLSDNPRNAIYFPQLLWLPLRHIVRFRWPRGSVKYLVPFAESAGRDHLCWHAKDPAKPFVVYAPRDSIYAIGFAPDFAASLYRLLVQEMVTTSLDMALDEDEEAVRDRLSKYVDYAAPVLRPLWVKTLRGLLGRSSSRTLGSLLGYISPDEGRSIITKDISFPMLDESFQQYE